MEKKNILWRLAQCGLAVYMTLLTGCSDSDHPLPEPEPVVPENPTPDPAPDIEIPSHDFLMGSLFGFEKDIRNGVSASKGGSDATTYYNKPLFEAGVFETTDADWWDNLVEEFLYSGMDYMVPNCRGRLPKADTDARYYTDHGDPTRIAELIAALKRRGTEAERLKIAIFDDAPASWAAARNLDLYGSYTAQRGNTAADRYPIEDLDDIYKYIWDYNIKLAFDNFYGENQENNKYLLRFQGKPLLYIWSPNGFLNVEYGGQKPDCTGRLKAILDKLHQDFKDTFGEEVFICVDKAFADRDPKVDRTVVDAMNDWFIASEQSNSRSSYTMRSFNGVNVGVAVPGFLTNDKKGDRMLFDSKHGKTLTDALDYFVKYKANLVFLEGFTDMLENAAYWRSTDIKYYDYPNQRLNILRRYSSTQAYPERLRVEAETCDYYKDNSAGNSGAQYRVGDLDVKRCTDGFNGWCVTDTEAGEWLRWVELPFRAGTTVIKLRYAAQEAAQVRIDVDGESGTTVTLPATGGNWADADGLTVSFETNGWHEVMLNIIGGHPELNYLTIESK